MIAAGLAAISSALSAAWARAGFYVALAAAAAGTASIVLASMLNAARRRGRLEAEHRALGRALDNAETRARVDVDVGRDADPAGRLRERWSRD